MKVKVGDLVYYRNPQAVFLNAGPFRVETILNDSVIVVNTTLNLKENWVNEYVEISSAEVVKVNIKRKCKW